MRRVFSGRSIAAVAAKYIFYSAADARDQFGATAVDWRDSGVFSVAYCGAAGLCAAGFLRVAGVVQKKVVTITNLKVSGEHSGSDNTTDFLSGTN